MPHIHELIDFTVEAFIVYKNKVLLRKHDKLGIWLSVGGHIELNEDPNQAAIREVKEEVGLDITIDDSLRTNLNFPDGSYELIPPYFLNVQKHEPAHKHITFVYFAKSKTNQVKPNVKSEKSDGIKWFTREQLKESEEILENIKFYALEALKKLA